jgi:hypothetical protein
MAEPREAPPPEEYRGVIDPASMVISPQDKIETDDGGIQPKEAPPGVSPLGSDTPVYGTETPYRKTPPHNFGTAAEAAATATPPTGAGVTQAQAVAGATPQCTVAPAVTGTLTSGQTLTCSTGTWVPAAASYTYQWYRAPDTVIAGATASTRVLAAGDVGKQLFCRVTGVATTYGAGVPKDSNITGVVA